ncbi:T9SS type A sorting domain-containing protein [Saprospira sp. CCB-QB6]|uniref:T9SS type A sorting domain-containing protein n=1 Tax=Saprospira sp. CCB-QB6 TaxID=3023936 RepID=UPI00234AC8FD|nr:T9SS type A sorting domain-containing protein [Saprospira sp. CCB-QB6]WCL82219.1 T9SS type A sorting domain-containing protein [Saprospira sp. CCB-QB6]
MLFVHYSYAQWTLLGSPINGDAAGDNGNGTDAGHVRVYKWNDASANWQQVGSDIDGEAASDFSGRSVSLNYDGSHVAIGSTENDDNGSDAGHVRVFEWSGSSWSQISGSIVGDTTKDFSGNSVALDSLGTTVAISSTGNDANGTDAGRTRVFQYVPERPSATTPLVGNNNIKIYPQPATSFINIEAEGLEAIYLYNHLGQLLKMQTLQSATNVYQLELQNYPAAVYYITILSKEGKYSQKVILR